MWINPLPWVARAGVASADLIQGIRSCPKNDHFPDSILLVNHSPKLRHPEFR